MISFKKHRLTVISARREVRSRLTVVRLKEDRLTVISASREQQCRLKSTSCKGSTVPAFSDQLNVRHGLYCDQLEGRHGAG